MRSPNRSRTLVLLLLAMACERPTPAPAKNHSVAAAIPTLRAEDSATLVALAAKLGTPGVLIPTMSALIPSVDSSVTLKHWLATHPGDVVTDTATVGVWDSEMCRVATGPVIGTNGRFVRSAIFELPPGPVSDSLPASADPGDWCRLGAVQVSAHFADTLSSQALFDSLARALTGTSALQHNESEGNGLTGSMAWYAHAGRVMVGEMADRPLVGIVGFYDHPPPGHGRRVLAVAYAPGGALDPSDGRWELDASNAEGAIMQALGDSALAMVSNPALDSQLRRILSPTKDGGQSSAHAKPRDSTLIDAAQLVHAANATLSPARRAASLVALDLATQKLASSFAASDIRSLEKPEDKEEAIRDSLLRERLAPLGITYESSPEGNALLYTRSLLTAAHATDSLGRGGHIAFLMLTHLGWNTTATCGDTEYQFEPVIAHGEGALRRCDDDPLTHYFVGLAWADIVTLAGQRGEQFARSRAPFLPRSAAARAKAVAHLRAAVSGLHDPVLRAKAWRVGMALMLGQSSGTRYYCQFVD